MGTKLPFRVKAFPVPLGTGKPSIHVANYKTHATAVKGLERHAKREIYAGYDLDISWLPGARDNEPGYNQVNNFPTNGRKA